MNDSNTSFVHARPGEVYSSRVTKREAISQDVVQLCIERPVNYLVHPGQSIVLEFGNSSSATLPVAGFGDASQIEFHIPCGKDGPKVLQQLLELKQHDKLTIQKPRGVVFFDEIRPQTPLLLIADGLGSAPMSAIVQQAHQRAHRGPIRLYHRGQSLRDLYNWPLLRALASDNSNLRLHGCLPTISKGMFAGRAQTLSEAVFEDRQEFVGWKIAVSVPLRLSGSLIERLVSFGAKAADIHTIHHVPMHFDKQMTDAASTSRAQSNATAS